MVASRLLEDVFFGGEMTVNPYSIMSRSAFDAHTDPLFKNLGPLNLESMYMQISIRKFVS